MPSISGHRRDRSRGNLCLQATQELSNVLARSRLIGDAQTLAACFAGFVAREFAVSPVNFAWLVVFGAVNLGAGLAAFTMGVRLIPAALAALLGTLEPVSAPIWVWLVHDEVPSLRTIIGGTVVFLALFIHLLMEWRRQPEPQVPVSP